MEGMCLTCAAAVLHFLLLMRLWQFPLSTVVLALKLLSYICAQKIQRAMQIVVNMYISCHRVAASISICFFVHAHTAA